MINCNYYLEDSFNAKCLQLQVKPDSFSMIHVNLRSIPKNLSKFEAYLHTLQNNFTVIGISETWLNETNASLYDLPGYKVVNNYRKGKRGGGVSLYIRNIVPFVVKNDLFIQEDIAETVFIELPKDAVGSDKDLVIGIVYKPPNTDVDAFKDCLNVLLDSVKKQNKYSFILGDYNINLLNADKHAPTSDFIDSLFSRHYIPLINKPTRVNEKSATLIDNIFTDKIDVESFQGILYTEISDHFPIFYICNELILKDSPTFVTRRVYSEANVSRFISELQSADWNKVTASDDPQIAYSVFHNEFTTFYTKSFPIKKIKLNYRNRKSWLCESLKRSIKIKNKLFCEYRHHRTKIGEMHYKKYKNKLTGILHKAEKDHYDKLFEANKNNMKKTWELISEIINRKRPHKAIPNCMDGSHADNDDKTIADNFNKFFVNVGPSLASKIPSNNTDPLSYMNPRNPNSIFLAPVDKAEIVKIIKNLKNGSPGWDTISSKVVRQCYEYFIDPLTYIANLAISKGIFPKELKIAKVIPLHKGDSIVCLFV